MEITLSLENQYKKLRGKFWDLWSNRSDFKLSRLNEYQENSYNRFKLDTIKWIAFIHEVTSL